MPESMTLFEFAVFTKQQEIEIGNWEDLGQYNVAFIRGWKILENNVTQAQSINLVKNADQLFDLLDSNRTEIAIFGPLRGRYLIKEKGMQDIKVLEPPLASRKVFLYLNKKHEGLIPEMSAALKSMKADGTYEAILRKTVTPYVSESGVKRMLLN